jgi:hypothetical protein
MHACVLSDIKSLHVAYYGWHDLPQGLWIINEYFKGRLTSCVLVTWKYPRSTVHCFWQIPVSTERNLQNSCIIMAWWRIASTSCILKTDRKAKHYVTSNKIQKKPIEIINEVENIHVMLYSSNSASGLNIHTNIKAESLNACF